MRQKRFLRFFSLLLAVICIASLFAGCKKEEELEENQIPVTWHMGKITSEYDKDSPYVIMDGVEGYSYSDVIHIEKAGTKITFRDNNAPDSVDTDYAKEDVYVISHWVKGEGDTYTMDLPGDHYTGVKDRAMEVASFDADKSVTYTYISSYANEYIRLCYASGQTGANTKKMQFAKVYSEYVKEVGTLISSKDGETLKRLKVARFLATSKDTQWHEELSGLTMYAMGDSYFGGSQNGKEYVWPNLLAQKYGMKFLNYGIGGSTISNNPNGNYQPMCNRIAGMAAAEPQIILFEGGRNDFCKNVPLGQDDDTDVTTFCGAINNCLNQLQAKYPNALIIGVTVWAHEETRAGQTQTQFGEAMLRLCATRGLPCFNAMDVENTKVDMDSMAFRRTYCQSNDDVSHLNTDGMILAEPAFEAFIAQAYRAFLAR